jgi:hypothetical protein
MENEFGLGPLACSDTSENYESIFRHLTGLLGRGIGPSQGHYPHRTAQHRKMRTHIHTSSGIRTHHPSVRGVGDHTCLKPRGHWDRQETCTREKNQ